MTDRNTLKEETEIKSDYVEATCGRLRSDKHFYNKKTCDDASCGAPVWTHPSNEPSCKLTLEKIEKNEAKFLTKNFLCIGCLSKRWVCTFTDHPSEESNSTKLLEDLNEKISYLTNKVEKMNNISDLLIENNLDPWIFVPERTKETYDGEYISKEIISTYYDILDNQCLFIGNLPNSKETRVVTLYLWPKYTGGKGLNLLDLTQEDINNPRNFLRVHKEIKKAYDNKQIYFSIESDKLKLTVLDPSLLDESNPSSTFTHGLNKQVTFKKMNGKIGRIQLKNLPFLNIISAHTKAALKNALRNNWITQEEWLKSSTNFFDLN